MVAKDRHTGGGAPLEVAVRVAVLVPAEDDVLVLVADAVRVRVEDDVPVLVAVELLVLTEDAVRVLVADAVLVLADEAVLMLDEVEVRVLELVADDVAVLVLLRLVEGVRVCEGVEVCVGGKQPRSFGKPSKRMPYAVSYVAQAAGTVPGSSDAQSLLET